MAKMKKTKQLKIGDIVFRCVDFGLGMKIMQYKIYEVRQTTDSILYAVTCENCRDHEDCCLLIAPYEQAFENLYRFVCMLNNDGYDEDEEDGYSFRNDQTLYHSTDDGNYYSTSKKEAIKQWANKRINQKKKHIENHKTEITRLNKELSELEAYIESANEK